jgi:hypothetical protein
MYAFVKMVYGEASDILFFEDSVGNTKIPNSVGSRQGCSLGSFLYCLAIHPLLIQLQDEFPELLILAYCDDVHLVGPPEMAILAYKRWAHLYSRILQGELRDDKGVVFSPNIPEEKLRVLDFPANMPISREGIRILGAPVGFTDFCCAFAEDIVDEISKDFATIGRMPSLQAQLLVATKSTVHRVNHLMRNIPGGEIAIFGHIAAKYDEAVLSVVRRISALSSLPDTLLGRSTTGNDTPYQRYREIVTARSHIMPEDRSEERV